MAIIVGENGYNLGIELARRSGPRSGMHIIQLDCGAELILTHVADAFGQSVAWWTAFGVGGLPVAQVAACITALEQGRAACFVDDQDPLAVASVTLTGETVCLALEAASHTWPITTADRERLGQALREVRQEAPEHLD